MKALLRTTFLPPLVRPGLVRNFLVALRTDLDGDVIEEVTVEPLPLGPDEEFFVDLETPVALGSQVYVEVISQGRFADSAPVRVVYQVPESVEPGEVTEAAVAIRDVVEEPPEPMEPAPESEVEPDIEPEQPLP